MTTLFHSCIQYVAGHLKDYDLQDFPDEFIIKYASLFTQTKPFEFSQNQINLGSM